MVGDNTYSVPWALYTGFCVCVYVAGGQRFPSALEAGFKSEHSTIQEETESLIS